MFHDTLLFHLLQNDGSVGLESEYPNWTAHQDCLAYKVELHWLEHLWNYLNMFETGVVRANEC